MTERFQRKRMPNRTSRRLVTGVMPFTFGFKWIDHLAKVCGQVSPLYGDSLPPFPLCPLWKEVTVPSPHLKSGLSLRLLEEVRHLSNYSDSSAGRFIFSPPFSY